MPTKRDYYTVQDDYPLRRLTKAKADVSVMAGGFDFDQFYDESLLRAFAGLGCFIEEEKVVKENAQSKTAKSVLSRVIASDDVF